MYHYKNMDRDKVEMTHILEVKWGVDMIIYPELSQHNICVSVGPGCAQISQSRARQDVGSCFNSMGLNGMSCIVQQQSKHKSTLWPRV